MCGLVGMMGRISYTQEKAFKQLLVIDQIRGVDSTGVYGRTNGGKEQLLKKAIDSTWFTQSGAYDTFSRIGDFNLLLGHNRAATVGVVIDEYAHPFDFSNIVGAHNGTLTSRYTLKDNKMFDVDSENLYHHMNELGVEDCYDNLYGAWALTWYNREENTFNFLRNNQRPLFYTRSQDNKTLYWASEAGMLEWILEKNKLPHQGVIEVPVDKHYKWEMPRINQEIGMPEVNVLQKKYTRSGKTSTTSTAKGARGNTTSGTNVTPLRGNIIPWGSKTTADALTEKCRALGGTTQEFQVVDADAVDYSGNKYVKCKLVDDPAVEVRMYVSVGKGPATYYMLKDSVYTFEAKLKPATFNSGYVYFKVNYRTLVELDSIESELVDEEEISEQDYQDMKWLTDGNCAWCTSPIVKGESFRWIGMTEVVCSCCKHYDEVQEYVNGNIGV